MPAISPPSVAPLGLVILLCLTRASPLAIYFQTFGPYVHFLTFRPERPTGYSGGEAP